MMLCNTVVLGEGAFAAQAVERAVERVHHLIDVGVGHRRVEPADRMLRTARSWSARDFACVSTYSCSIVGIGGRLPAHFRTRRGPRRAPGAARQRARAVSTRP